MKRKYVFTIGIISMLVLTGILAFAHTAEDPFVTDLIAGQHYDVGNVSVWNDESNLYVKYNTTGGWSLAETHLHAATSLDGIPQTKKDNPIPGQFDYQNDSHDVPTSEYMYTIPLNGWMVGDELYIAAHGVVETMPFSIGTVGSLEVCRNWIISFFDIIFDGEHYYGWCVDLDHGIRCGDDYIGIIYSTYEPGAPVDKPENLDLVNYILNNDYSSIGATWNETQIAIWTLIDDKGTPKPGNVGFTWDQTIVDQIIADAYANGEGFVPGEGDLIGFIIYAETPEGIQKQTTLIMIPYPGDETAWADGLDFDGNNWAMYFTYTVQ